MGLPERLRCYVDRGYKGHGVTGTEVFISGQRRGLTPTIRRELRRRSAIEPVIGHQKSENRLDRNFLRGAFGDVANALLAGLGYNLRAILRKLRFLFAWILAVLGLWNGVGNLKIAMAELQGIVMPPNSQVRSPAPMAA